MRSFRILVIDDFERLRRFVLSALEQRPEFQVVGEASDGLEGVQQAEELRPDVIVLDVGLPGVNGIEAGRRIREVSPKSRILFLSQESSPEIVREAFQSGARGYLLKSDVGTQLLPAIDSILEDRPFVSRGLPPGAAQQAPREVPGDQFLSPERSSLPPPRSEAHYGHQVATYRDDASFVSDFALFLAAALKVGNPVIVIATESHRRGILQQLHEQGWDIDRAMKEGSYIELDASQTLSTFMVNDWPDSQRLSKLAAGLIQDALKGAKSPAPRVAVCGECAPNLLAQGKGESAIEVECLWDKMARTYEFDLLCGYVLQDDLLSEPNSHTFRRICAVHSTVYSV